MPSHKCQCGATYRFAETSVGKKGKCKRCGVVFTLSGEAGEIPLAIDETPLLATSAPGDAAEFVASAVGIPRPMIGAAPESEPIVEAPGSARGYLDSLMWTLLFPADPRNLLLFVLLWVALVVSGVLLSVPAVSIRLFSFSLILWLCVYGWYAGYLFQIVEGAACGDDQLPDFAGLDILDDIIRPGFSWVGSWFVALVPAILWVLGERQDPDPLPVVAAIGSAFKDPMATLATDPVLLAALCAGLFLWPILVLTIALGGFSAIWRVDLMVQTIARSVGPYLLTVALVFGAMLADILTGNALLANAATRQLAGAGLGVLVTAKLLGLAISLYCDIVALRAIGLYYRHFKDRFAWDWG